MPRRSRARVAAMALAVLAGTLALAASEASPAPAPRPASSTLTVFAAASLTDAFAGLAQEFERAHPGVTVRLAFAGSQQLVAQLASGARADVFAAADMRSMDDAARQGSLDGAARVFARNRLAVIVPASDPARLDRLDQLARPGVKLVLCAPSVPAGRYARELFARLERAGVLPKGGAAKTLANVVSEEDNVRAVLGKVRLGEADAGVVYRSDLGAGGAGGPRELAVPDSLSPVASYPIAVVRGAPSRELARAFVGFACGAEGQRSLVKHGFLPAAGAP